MPYSDHSSYDELLHFVRLVRPRSVQGIVKSLTSRCNMEVFNHLLDSTPAVGITGMGGGMGIDTCPSIQADYEIPDGIAQLLSVQSREHPPIPSHDCRHKVSPTVMTINNRGRKRAVGVCYLSPPKKRNSHDEKGEVSSSVCRDRPPPSDCLSHFRSNMFPGNKGVQLLQLFFGLKFGHFQNPYEVPYFMAQTQALQDL